METGPNRKACLKYQRSYKEKKGSFSVNFFIINYKSVFLAAAAFFFLPCPCAMFSNVQL